MRFERFTDPVDVNPDQIAAILAEGDVPTVQFSKPLGDIGLLDKVDALCKIHGDRLEVRFFGYYSPPFDASILARVPHVQWLSVDCLTRATGIEQLYALNHLRKLSLGIHELDLPDILARIQIKTLKELRVGETHKNNIDLAPLEQCQTLSRLFIGSHTRGIDVLRKLKGLKNLTLGSISKKPSLAVVSDILGLKTLRISLGGRMDINEISHSQLTELEVVRVLGLSSMGDLGRFPVLQKLRIEDQIRLESIDLSGATLLPARETVNGERPRRALIPSTDRRANLKTSRLDRGRAPRRSTHRNHRHFPTHTFPLSRSSPQSLVTYNVTFPSVAEGDTRPCTWAAQP